MLCTPSIWRITVFMAVLSVLFASGASAAGFPRFNDLIKRQSGANTTPATPPTRTPTPTPTPSVPSTPTTPTSPPSTPTVPTDPSTSQTSTPSETPTTRSTSNTSRITTSTPIISSATIFQTTVFVTTGAGGEVSSITSTRQTVVQSTAGYGVATITPGLTGGASGSDDGGLSKSNKNIIAGVVGGVGGAILLAGIGFVIWRVWGRKRHDPDDDLDYAAGTGQGLGSSGSAGKETGMANDTDHDARYQDRARPNAAANF